MINTIILDGKLNREFALEKSIESLLSGNPIAFPTETVYGLGTPIFYENGIHKIYEIKQRNIKNPLSAHIGNLSDVEHICSYIPDKFYKLAEKFLPGPLAIVLKKKKNIINSLSEDTDSIGIRYPDNDIFLSLVRKLGQPILATSANLSGRPSPNNAISVYEDLNGKIEIILDGGHCKYSIESTVLSLATDKPLLIRPGVIEQREIEELLGEKVYSLNQSIIMPNQEYYGTKIKSMPYRTFITEDIEKLKNFLVTNNKNRILLFLSEESFTKIDWEYKLILKTETFFENLRYAEKNNFENVIFLFDKFVKNIELIKHRLRDSETL